MSPSAEACFVLSVKPRHEKSVFNMLRGKGFEPFLPIYARRTASRTTELPLFPGYVFCRFDPNNRLPILCVPGVFSIVGFGGRITPVDETEIAMLQRIVRSSLNREPWPSLPSGTVVTVIRGPRQGLRGVVFRQKTSLRIIVSVTVLQRSVSVEMQREWLDDEAPQFARAYAAQ